jgi:hypothetical protein
MENEVNSLIVQRADGSYMRVKRVDVHVEYVNADGTPAELNGKIDSGNNALSINEEHLAAFPQEVIQSLAAIYDASLAMAE